MFWFPRPTPKHVHCRAESLPEFSLAKKKMHRVDRGETCRTGVGPCRTPIRRPTYVPTLLCNPPPPWPLFGEELGTRPGKLRINELDAAKPAAWLSHGLTA